MMITTTQPESTSPPTTQSPLTIAHPKLAMLKKEFRELLPGGIVIFGILSMIYFLIVMSGMPGENSSRHGEYLDSIFRDAPLLAFPLIAMGLSGILIGGLQFYKESKMDSYALLVHRPISRTSIFLCKVVMAHIMMVLGAALPTIALYAWARSYHVATMDLINPWFLHTLAGLFAVSGSYFFGVLMVTRVSASWYGSLFMPLLWAGVFGVWAGTQESPRTFFPIAVLGLIPMVIASHAAFTTFSQIRLQPWYARLSLAFLVLPGIASFWLVAGFLLFNFSPRGEIFPVHIEVGVMPDGTPVTLYNGQLTRIRYTIMGGSLSYPNDQRNGRIRELYHLTPLSLFNAIDKKYMVHIRPGVSPILFRSLMIGSNEYLPQIEDNGRYFSLYQVPEYRKVGIFDTAGFHPNTDESHAPFSHSATPLFGRLFLMGSGLYQVDPTGKVSLAWQSPDEKAFTSLQVLMPDTDLKDALRWYLFLATTDHIYRISVDPFRHTQDVQILASWPREPGYSDITLMPNIVLNDDDAVIRYDQPGKSESLMIFTRTQRRIYVSAPYYDIPSMGHWPWGQIIPFSVFGIAGRIACAAQVLWMDPSNPSSAVYWLFSGARSIRVINACTMIIALLAGGLMWLLMSRQSHTFGKKVVWFGITLFIGPLAFLLRPVIVPTRILKPCPDCRKKRPVELATCPHCSNPWPPPQHDGREILSAQAPVSP